MRFTLVTPPAKEPLDLYAEVKPHLRIEPLEYSEDDLVSGYVAAARFHAEGFTRRQLIDATWEVWMDGFPSCGMIELPFPPLKTVTSVKYLDTGGTEQTLSSSLYTVSAPGGPFAPAGRIVLKYGEVWPSTQAIQEAVKVRFTAGYGAAPNEVPAGIRAGMLLHVGELYARREDAIVGVNIQSVPRGVDAALWPFRTWSRSS